MFTLNHEIRSECHLIWHFYGARGCLAHYIKSDNPDNPPPSSQLFDIKIPLVSRNPGLFRIPILKTRSLRPAQKHKLLKCLIQAIKLSIQSRIIRWQVGFVSH